MTTFLAGRGGLVRSKTPPTPPAADVLLNTGMTTTAINSAISASTAGQTIGFGPGTYLELATIVPKASQIYFALDGPGTVTLNGNGQNRRAFDGQFGPTGVTLRGLIVTGYWNGFQIGGSGPTFSPIGAGSAQDSGAQAAIIHSAGPNWVIEDCQVIANYGEAVRTGDGTRISRCEISDNSHLGIGAARQNTIIEDSSLRNNCRWHMGMGWESGAVKWGGGATPGGAQPALPPNVGHIIRRCKITQNWGPGLWFDWDCIDSEIHNCSIWGNLASAILLEGCGGFYIHHNQLESTTGSDNSFGSFKVCVSFQNSKKTRLESNLLVVRQDAIWLGEQNRSGGGGGTPQGGVYVGWFTGTQNNIQDNTYLMMNNGAFYSTLNTHGCSNANVNCTGLSCPQLQGTEATGCLVDADPQGPIVDDENPATSNYRCFLPTATDNHYNTSTNNAYQMASGTPSRFSFDTNPLILTDPTVYLPDWEVVPSWSAPPGHGRTFYVSPTGSNSNPGTEALPFLTINGVMAAAMTPALGAGDTIVLEDGTYTTNGTVISKGGTSGGYLTIKARNRGMALIRPTGGNHGIHIQKDYVVLDGLDVSGPNLVFHGIAADRLDGVGTARGVHHIQIKHCISHDNTISGIGLAYGDYYLVEYCETYGNCHSCPQGIQGSGISIYQAREFDAASVFHNIIHSNISYDNIIDHLRNGNGGPFYLVTADAGTDTFTMVSTTAGPPTNASTVRFTAGPGGSLPAGIVAGTNYTITNRQTAPTPDTFQVQLSGLTVDLTSNGSGDIYCEPDHTDANGIIIDDFRNSQTTPGSGTIYARTTLIENNLCYGNGNRGIHLFKSNNVTVKNNTCYGNNLDPLSQGTWREELSNAQSSFNGWVNNIGAVLNTTIHGVTLRAIGDRDIGGDRNVDTFWASNLTYDFATPGSNSFIMSLTRTNATLTESAATGPTGQAAGLNKFADDPLFVDRLNADLHLQAGSQAIDAGTNVYSLATYDLDGNPRVAGAAVDIGCYERP